MTKRTTLQQRARELQRAEQAQGLPTSYHDALNRVRAAAETASATPSADPAPLPFATNRTAHQEAERALHMESLARRDALMRTHTKGQLAAIVRRTWAGGYAPPERRDKQELANDIVLSEDMHERYEAYGRVALVNGEARPADRPHCGGADCAGHTGMTPWPATRARFRAKAPCIGADAELGARALPADATKAERARAESLWVPVAADQPCPCSGPCRHGQVCPDEAPHTNYVHVHQARGGRLVHVERVGGLLPDVHMWVDGYECPGCEEGTREAVSLPGLPWGEPTPGGDPQPFDGVPGPLAALGQ